MADYEQKIFEQVIDNYFGNETNNSFRVEEDVNVKGIKLKVKDTQIETKDENSKKTAIDNQKKKRESKSKAVLIEAEYHENLPQGWKKVVVQRTTGATAGKYDVYFFTPSGRKLRSKNEIKDYSEKHNLSLDLTNFGFSRPKRDQKPVAKISNKKSKSKVPSNHFEKDSNSTSFDMSDSSNHIDSQLSNQCEENDSMTNGDTCISVDNQILNCIDQDIKAFAAEVLEPVIELDLPNTSFSNSNTTNDKVNVENSYLSSVELDNIDQSHLGKTFKIERPLSFSCF